MRKLAVTALIGFALSTLAVSANAETLVDVGVGNSVATGAGVVGASGDTWNRLGAGSLTASNLVDTSGHNTGESVTIVADNGGGGFANTSPNTSITQSYDWVHNGPNTAITVTLTGLTANSPYDLYFYNVTDPCCSDGRPGTVTASAANGGASAFVASNTTDSSWVAGQNYVELPVFADATGTLVFSEAEIGGGETDMNGFQLQSVPEPGSLAAMLGSGAVGLLAYGARRRRKAQR
jgi:hypothetical protein